MPPFWVTFKAAWCAEPQYHSDDGLLLSVVLRCSPFLKGNEACHLRGPGGFH